MKNLFCLKSRSSVRFVSCAALSIAFSFHIRAQEMAIKIYTAKDGLPSTYVFTTYQDKLGYLWVGTPDGVSRFDGKYFTNYGLSDGLPDTRVGAGLMDRRLRYWVGTPRGVAEFKGNRFITYRLPGSQNIHWVYNIFESKEHQIWSLTDEGIYQLNLNKWEKIKLYAGFEKHACRNIIQTDEGLYINYGDLLVLKKSDDTYKVIGPPKDVGYYYNHLSISAGRILLSTPDGMYEIIHQQLVKMPGVLGKLKGLYSYFLDSKKRFWIAGEKMGVQVIEPGDTAHFIKIYKHPVNTLVQHISEDNQGNIWIASGNGLIRVSEKGFTVFKKPATHGESILINVFQPPSGPLIINNGGLTLQTFENGVFSEKKLHWKGSSSLQNDELIIDNYAFDNRNRYWYYLRNLKLVFQEGNAIYDQHNKLAHLGYEVFDVLFDNYRKKIMAAVGTQKFPCQFDDTSYSALSVSNSIDVKGDIRRLHQCTNGTLLFATSQGLVYSVDKQNICKLQLNEFNAEGLISKFYNDPSGDLWIIYGGRGLRRYSWQKDSLIFKEQLTKQNSLSSDNIKSICFDNKDNLWICTNSDVTIFSNKIKTPNNQSYQIIGYFDSEDLNIEDSYGAKMARDLRGNIWLYSGSHLICFYPDKINYSLPIPSIAIENVELNLRQTNWAEYADSMSGIFQLPVNPRLSNEYNTIGFNFKGISTSGTNGIKYSYQLEGVENSWSIPSSNNFVSFVRLPPGTYVFKVKAQLPNTNWSEPAIFSFEIMKAFWQTWWFGTLATLLVLSIIAGILWQRFQRFNDLLILRTKISRDLHDEIGSTLSSINILSKVSQKNLDKDVSKASGWLQKITEQSESIQQSISDIVWSISPDKDKMENLVIRMREYLGKTAEPKNMEVEFLADDSIFRESLSTLQRQNVFLIFKEAANNAVKYSQGKKLIVLLGKKNSQLKLTIQDDGVGFETSHSTTSNGIKNMKNRANELKGILNIGSAPGQGTKIELICPVT